MARPPGASSGAMLARRMPQLSHMSAGRTRWLPAGLQVVQHVNVFPLAPMPAAAHDHNYNTIDLLDTGCYPGMDFGPQKILIVENFKIYS